MKTLHKRCAGLDVHKKEVVACLRVVARSKATYEVRRFPTTTRDLIALAEWLEAAQCAPNAYGNSHRSRRTERRHASARLTCKKSVV